MKLYNCAFPGCYVVVDAPRSYCKRHEAYGVQQAAKRIADAKAPRWAGAERPNDALYNTARWRKESKAWVKEHPECTVCGTTLEPTVDHIVAPKGNDELFWDHDNWQTLCRYHHNQKTSAENRKRC